MFKLVYKLSKRLMTVRRVVSPLVRLTYGVWHSYVYDLNSNAPHAWIHRADLSSSLKHTQKLVSRVILSNNQSEPFLRTYQDESYEYSSNISMSICEVNTPSLRAKYMWFTAVAGTFDKGRKRRLCSSDLLIVKSTRVL